MTVFTLSQVQKAANALLSQAEKEALAERYLPTLRQIAKAYGLTRYDRDELESLLLVELACLLNDPRVRSARWVADQLTNACCCYYYYADPVPVSLEVLRMDEFSPSLEVWEI